MNIPYDNPEALINKIVEDLDLKLTPEQEESLRKDLLDIFVGRVCKLLLDRGHVEKLPEGIEAILEFATKIPNFEKALQLEAIKFYEEMSQTSKIVKSGIEK